MNYINENEFENLVSNIYFTGDPLSNFKFNYDSTIIIFRQLLKYNLKYFKFANIYLIWDKDILIYNQQLNIISFRVCKKYKIINKNILLTWTNFGVKFKYIKYKNNITIIYYYRDNILLNKKIHNINYIKEKSILKLNESITYIHIDYTTKYTNKIIIFINNGLVKYNKTNKPDYYSNTFKLLYLFNYRQFIFFIFDDN